MINLTITLVWLASFSLMLALCPPFAVLWCMALACGLVYGWVALSDLWYERYSHDS